jgi:apolipoprotein N-acyltransferase
MAFGLASVHSRQTRLVSLAEAGWRGDVAAGALGAFSAGALPPFHLVPLLLFTVPALLTLIDQAPRPATAFRFGFWFGFGHHLLGLYWITDAILFEASRFWWFVPLAVPGLSALLAIFIAVPCALARLSRAGLARLLVLAGLWTLGDLARQFVASGFPWNPWASVWAIPGPLGDIMLQPLAWIGTPGLTLVTVFVAGLPSLGRRGWMALAAAMLLWAGLGAFRVSERPLPAPELHVVVVQGDIPEGEKWSAERAEQILDRYLLLTAEAIAKVGPGKAVVVWPETASPYPLEEAAMLRSIIAASANPVGRAASAWTLVGSVRFGPDKRPRNSLFALAPSGAVGGVYDKWHLVPGGEYQPNWLPLPVQIVPGGGFVPGSGPHTLDGDGLVPVGPFICYEAIFPHAVIDEAHRPQWMVNVTNDAWFGNSSGPRQHLAAARMRAVEEGLPLVRAANTGISAVFDAHGHEIARLPLNREGSLVVPLPGPLPQPFFARFGLWIPGLLAAFMVALGIIGSRVYKNQI